MITYATGAFPGSGLVNSGESFAKHWAILFQPISSEADPASKHPNSAPVFRNLDAYAQVSEEIKATITPELELIESRVVAPVKELQNIMKVIRKTITKREHKVLAAPTCSAILT